jgi:hypothetical protein
VDDGGAFGGGSCTATDWVCDGTNTFTVQQGDLTVPLLALHGAETVAEFYSYGYPMAASSNAGEETSNRGNIYLYYDDVNSLFSLVIVLDKFEDGSGGTVHMTIDGLGGTGTILAVKDDPGDSYNLATGEFKWNWLDCCTDGMALTLAGTSTCLTFNPTLVTGINSWAVVSHNPDGTRTETILPGTVTEPFTVCSTASLHQKVSSGVDTCGGTVDNPSVTTFACAVSDGILADRCVASVTAKQDSCLDSGDGFGGGSCSAIDWDCADGVLASSSNSGTDTCGGTEDAPSLAYWTCAASDGAVGDLCVAATVEKFDSCSDSGDAFGGGACSAIDWDCTAGVLASSGTEGTDTCGGDADAPSVAFWSCQAGDGLVADACVAATTTESDSCDDSGNAFGGGACSAVDWDCTDGVLASSSNAGTDTCGGTEDAPTVQFWSCVAGDGAAADLCVAAVTEEYDSCSDNGDTFGGGSCSAVDWDCEGGVLASSSNAGVDTCGGTEDAPSVEYWVCAAGDGTVNDVCDSYLTEKADACSDTGDMWGGGSCSAIDWDCTGGVLASNGTAGTDACGGDVDAPNVTFWSCNATDGGVADACLSEVTQKQDLCVDTGDASGGGTCEATNWVCTNAVLSSTSTDGVDTCGDGSDQQLYYFTCAAQDGTAGDYCEKVMDVTPPDVQVVLAPQAVLEDGTTVYQVYCDVTDVCDDNPTVSSLVETPSANGLSTKLKTHARTDVKFNLNNGKLDIFAPDPAAVLDDIVELGGLPIEEGQSVVITTHAGLEYHYTFKVMEGIDLLHIKGPLARIWCSGTDDAGHEADASWSEEYHKENDCGCRCQCDCPAFQECSCQCNCEEPACACDCDADGNCDCTNPNGGEPGGEEPPCEGDGCNQGVGNGDEGCDPGNSNQGDPTNSNDENGGTPGNPGKGKKK